jgi:hypothetical protein
VIGGFAHLENLATGATSGGDPLPSGGGPFLPPPSSGAASVPQQYGYELQIEPHSFVAFREQP